MNSFDNIKNRTCAKCSISEDQQVLFEILLPSEIQTKTPFCRKCLDIVIDNSIQKNRAKQRDE